MSIFRVQVLVFRAFSRVPLHIDFLNSASFTVSQAQPLISRNVQNLCIFHAFGCLGGCRVESQEINQLGPSSLPMAIGTAQ